ncbi:MAG: efflux RND transporter periplasmic adaptor subunit [Planctomycetota bacterium]|nr:MAG: efflux RND transporter periplasmic adaptor subunit [Planctomycetota bacterium]
MTVALVQHHLAWSQPTETPLVLVQEIIESKAPSGRPFVGTVQPHRRVVVGAAIAGRVEKFVAIAGTMIRQGDLLAQLRTDTMEIELKAAQAELELARQALAELVNGARPEEIEEAKAVTDAARAVHEAAQAQLRRLSHLAATGASTAADYEAAQEKARTARAQLHAAEAVLRRIQAGARPEAIAQAKAREDLQQQRVHLLENQLSKHSIRCPFDGIVAVEHTDEGAWLSSGDPVCEIVDLATVEIEVPVPAEVVASLELNTSVRVEFPGFPRLLMTGQIERVIPVGDPRARTYPVVIAVSNRVARGIPELLAGMLARVELPVGPSVNAPVVPKDALVLNGEKRSVFVVESLQNGSPPSGRVREVMVELGVEVGDQIQVKGELHAGQHVVVLGNERLVDGQQVRIGFADDDRTDS